MFVHNVVVVLWLIGHELRAADQLEKILERVDSKIPCFELHCNCIELMVNRIDMLAYKSLLIFVAEKFVILILLSVKLQNRLTMFVPDVIRGDRF